MLSGARLAEERVEGVVAAADRLVARHLTVGLDAVLEAVQLPAGIAYLQTALADVDAEDFTLQTEKSLTIIINQLSIHKSYKY